MSSVAPSQEHVIFVVDATAPVQRWVDDFIVQARAGAPGDWPHPHPHIPNGRCTVAQFNEALAENGLPPLGELDFGTSLPSVSDGPNKGSKLHNVLHRLLGDFH